MPFGQSYRRRFPRRRIPPDLVGCVDARGGDDIEDEHVTRVLSGIKPTGYATLGNYLGAHRIWIQDQHEHESYWPVVDLHALTVQHDPEEFREITLHHAR